MRSSYHSTKPTFPRRGPSMNSRRRTPFGSAADSPRNVAVATEACATKMAAAQQQVQSLTRISLTSPGAPAPTALCGPDDPIEACRTQTKKGSTELGEKLLCQLCSAFHVAHKKEPDDRVESAWALNYPLDKVHEAFMTGEDHIMCTETCGQDFEAASATILDSLLCKLQHDGATAKCALEKYRRLVDDYRCCEAELRHCAPGPNRARLSQDRKNAHKKAHQVWCSVFGPLRLSRQVLAGPGIDGSFTQAHKPEEPGTGRYRPCVTRGYLYNLATFVAKNLLVRNEREVLRLCRTDMLQAPFSGLSDPCACPADQQPGETTPASVSDSAMVREVLRLWGMEEETFKKMQVRTIGQALQALLGSQACSFGVEQLFKSAGACPSGPDGPYSAFRRCFETWRPGLGCHTPEDDARARRYLSIFADPLRGALGYYLSFCQKFAAAIGDSLHCVGEYPDPNEHNSSSGSSSAAKMPTEVFRTNEAAYRTWVGQLSSLVGKYQLSRTTCSSTTEFWKDVMDDLRTGLMQGVVGHHVRRAGSAGRHTWAVQFDCELGRIAEKTDFSTGSINIKKTDGTTDDTEAGASNSAQEAENESKMDRLFFIPYRNTTDKTNHGDDEKEWRKKNKQVKRARQLVQRQWHPCLMDAAHVEDHLVYGKTLGHKNSANRFTATQSNLFESNKNVFADNRNFYPTTKPVVETTTLVASTNQKDVPRKSDTTTSSFDGYRSDWRPSADPREVKKGDDFGSIGSVNGAHFAATLDLGLRDAKPGNEYLGQWARTNEMDRELAWGGNGAVYCFYRCLMAKTTKKEAREHFRSTWKKELQNETSKLFKDLTTTVLAETTTNPTSSSPDSQNFATLLDIDGEFKKAVGVASGANIVTTTTKILDETKEVHQIFAEVIKSMEEHGLGDTTIKDLVPSSSSSSSSAPPTAPPAPSVAPSKPLLISNVLATMAVQNAIDTAFAAIAKPKNTTFTYNDEFKDDFYRKTYALVDPPPAGLETLSKISSDSDLTNTKQFLSEFLANRPNDKATTVFTVGIADVKNGILLQNQIDIEMKFIAAVNSLKLKSTGTGPGAGSYYAFEVDTKEYTVNTLIGSESTILQDMINPKTSNTSSYQFDNSIFGEYLSVTSTIAKADISQLQSAVNNTNYQKDALDSFILEKFTKPLHKLQQIINGEYNALVAAAGGATAAGGSGGGGGGGGGLTTKTTVTTSASTTTLQLAVERAVDGSMKDDEKFEKFMEHCVGPVLKHKADRDCVLQDLRTMRADKCADDPDAKDGAATNIVKIDRAKNTSGDTGHPDDLSWKDFAVTLNKWTPADHCRSSFVHANLCPAEMGNDKSQRILFAKVFNMLEGSIKKGMFRTAASVLAQTAKENSCGLGDDLDLWT